MSTQASPDAASPPSAREALEANLRRVEALTTRLTTALATKRQVPAALQGPGPDLWAKAGAAWMAEAAANPARLIERQAALWADTLRHWSEVQALALGTGEAEAPADPRFKNPLWRTHPWFAFARKQWETSAEAIRAAVAATEGLDARDRQRLGYVADQMIALMAPTNFLATNPDALERAAATEGQSLVDGLENLVRDLERNRGEVIVRLADESAFQVGGNLATTPGSVVHRNRLMELIQYAPTTPGAHKLPLVIVPPWINKFYILDLRPQNSLIRWLVGQGFTVFVVSWRNPGPSMRDVGLAHYVEEGFLAAMREAAAICGTRKVNAVGYCIAGTTLALTLALLRKRKERLVNSATFLTTLTDFSDPGEMGVFLGDDFVDGIEAEARRAGVLDRFFMQRTFSYLRPNDLIYAPAIRAYMMGEPPPAFDLLHWNGDGTNLPAAMAVEYLRGLCQEDRLARKGFTLMGERLRLRDVDVPLMAVACETDHIAAWRSSYRGVAAMGSRDKSFVLSGSGHIAGIVNPPERRKYGHWTNAAMPEAPEDWLAGAAKHEGSWWPLWAEWLRARSGKEVPARGPGDAAHPVLAPAPGAYVTEEPVA